MSISDRLDEITARCNAATEGAWEADFSEEDNYSVKRVGTEWIDGLAFAHGTADAEFMAAARTDVPAMLAALRAVLDLHKPEKFMDFEETCSGCDIGTLDPPTWPCQTFRAIEAALGEGHSNA